MSRDSEVMILWAPAHVRIAGNEGADMLAKEAAEGQTQAVSDEYRRKASLSRLPRAASENRSRATAQWVASHVRSDQSADTTPPGVPAFVGSSFEGSGSRWLAVTTSC